MPLLRLIRRDLRPHRGALAVLMLLHLAQAAATLGLPALNAALIDRGVLAGDDDVITSTGIVMLGVALAQVAFALAAAHLAARISARLGRDLRSRVFRQVTSFSAREVARFGAPSLITRVTNDAQQVQALVAAVLAVGIAAPLTVAGGVLMVLRQDVELSARLSVSLVALAAALGVVFRRLLPLSARTQGHIDGVNRVLREQITGVRVVRAFTREAEESARFAKVNGDLTTTSLAVARLDALVLPILVVTINAASVSVLWLGADAIARGDLSIGSLVAFLTYFVILLVAVLSASSVVLLAPRAAVCADRITQVLVTTPSVRPPTNPVPATTARGHLAVRGVEYRYPGAEAAAISDVTFSVGPGVSIAVVGTTGSGKSTLVAMLTRLADPTAGSVAIDGVDVRRLARGDLAGRIAVVPQKVHLFAGTVASNLRFGRSDASDDELWAALEVAQAVDFVRAMPDQLDARVDQGGRNVSGGQRQRLAIARALVRRPVIYVFDDAFAALDAATDARLRAALGPWVAGSAVIDVTQRVTSVEHADQILVLDGGRQVGLGRHDDLVATCAPYRELVDSQRQAAHT